MPPKRKTLVESFVPFLQSQGRNIDHPERCTSPGARWFLCNILTYLETTYAFLDIDNSWEFTSITEQ